MADLDVCESEIPGLLFVGLPVHADSRGWFKENWQRRKMITLGLPDFGPVQNNVAFNCEAGVTRGVHAEPWDKYVGLATGEIYGAWVDLRQGPTFGRVVQRRLGPETTVYVPRGVGNAYQTTTPGTAYTYLVNRHWEASASYTFVNLADPALGIHWPIDLSESVLSDADRGHPLLCDVHPVPQPTSLILGAGGQLGRALTALLPDSRALFHEDLDVTDARALADLDLADVDTVINASAYTDVEAAETVPGRRRAWDVNVRGVANIVRVCRDNRIRLVHVSSDFVFDGTETLHTEAESPSPLSVYGQTKAAGDTLVSTLDRHHLCRTSRLVGEGSNFVRTMARMASSGASPRVVADQWGRLTFAADLAQAIRHLISTDAPSGTYNITNEGPSQSWADVACEVFRACGRPGSDVVPILGSDFISAHPSAPRPRNSTLDLTKIAATGFVPRPAGEALKQYLRGLGLGSPSLQAEE